MVAEENFGEFGKFGAIHQSFIHPHLCLCIIKLRVDYKPSTMNEDRVNSGEHASLKLVTTIDH